MIYAYQTIAIATSIFPKLGLFLQGELLEIHFSISNQPPTSSKMPEADRNQKLLPSLRQNY